MPLTAADVVEFGTFRTIRQANRRLQKMVEAGSLCVTTVRNPNGRPSNLYSRYRCNHPAHDHLFGKIILHVMPDLWTCRDVDGTLADSEWWFQSDPEEHYYVEFHTGSMTLAQLAKKRIPKYDGAKSPCLWVVHGATETLAEREMELMLRRFGTSRMHLFTTSYRLLRDPYGEVIEYVDDEERLVTSLPET